MKKDYILILLGIAAIIFMAWYLGYFGGIQRVGAIAEEKVTICHCEQPDSDSPLDCQTLEVGAPAGANHLEEHEADSEGACLEVTPSITPEVTPTVTPELTPTVTATPSATPTPTTPPAGGGDGRSDGRSSCPECTQAPKTVVPAAAPATGRG